MGSMGSRSPWGSASWFVDLVLPTLVGWNRYSEYQRVPVGSSGFQWYLCTNVFQWVPVVASDFQWFPFLPPKWIGLSHHILVLPISKNKCSIEVVIHDLWVCGLWVPMWSSEYQRIPVCSSGFQWVLMCTNVSQWVPVGASVFSGFQCNLDLLR